MVIARWTGSGNLLVVTHGANIRALTGVSPASGEIVVVRAGAGGGSESIGRLLLVLTRDAGRFGSPQGTRLSLQQMRTSLAPPCEGLHQKRAMRKGRRTRPLQLGFRFDGCFVSACVLRTASASISRSSALVFGGSRVKDFCHCAIQFIWGFRSGKLTP